MSNIRSKNIVREIEKLKEDKNAVILAHNYQTRDIQRIADFVGDSLEMAVEAMRTEADRIVVCGVDFMAETVAALNPDKSVVMPSANASCPMASKLSARLVAEIKRKNPDTPFVTYVNSYAAAKAEADICCTSANAVKIIEKIDADRIFLGPDANLAWFASLKTGKNIVPVPSNGFCYVHRSFGSEDVDGVRKTYPDAVIIVHPECNPEVQMKADYVGSTSQMMEFARKCDSDTIIVGTEIGMIERMRAEIPGKVFVPLRRVLCGGMKANSLEAVLHCLKCDVNIVKLPESVAERARRSIERMMNCKIPL